MKNLIKTGIELRVKQTILDEIADEIHGSREEMAEDIMDQIDQIVNAEDKLYKKLSSYLKKTFGKNDGWLFPQQFINEAIINAHHYGESGLSIPKNEKVLSFLLPKLSETFNVSFVKIEKEDFFEILEEYNLQYYSRKNWDFYRLTVIEQTGR